MINALNTASRKASMPLSNTKSMDCSIVWAKEHNTTQDHLKAFIADSFDKSYEAKVSYFCELLVGCEDAEGKVIAAFGINQLDHQKAFLEQYLNKSIEEEISSQMHCSVNRNEIFELGNLSGDYPGATRHLIKKMTKILYQKGARWVVFTANKKVLNTFHRLHLEPVSLAKADPKRLPNHGENWGHYYDSEPEVMFIKVPNHD